MASEETHAQAADRADKSDARADASDDRADQLETALDSRDTIGMAKGILMHAENIGPDEAFQILVNASQHQNLKLRDIAAALVAQYPKRTA